MAAGPLAVHVEIAPSFNEMLWNIALNDGKVDGGDEFAAHGIGEKADRRLFLPRQVLVMALAARQPDAEETCPKHQ
jgi:hypothetical protein